MISVSVRMLLLAVAILQIASRAAAAEALAGKAILVEGEAFAGALEGLDADSASFGAGPDGETVSTPYAELVRWGAPCDPAPRARVRLVDGSELVAAEAWARGGALRVSEEQLVLAQSTASRATYPKRLVHSILFEAARDGASLERIAAELQGELDGVDRLWLVGGDRLDGELVGIDSEQLHMKLAGEPIDIDLARVAAVRLAGAPLDTANATLAIGLLDGSLLFAVSATVDGDGAGGRIELGSGAICEGIEANEVAFVQPLNSVRYLSDMAPIDYLHTPYFELPWPFARDENLLGRPLRVEKRRYLKGIAMHSASRLIYRLSGERRFSTSIAIDDVAGNENGSVKFQIYVIRDGKFELAYESPIVRGGDAPIPVSIDTSGGQGLALVVDYADFGDEQDHADWLDARLVE